MKARYSIESCRSTQRPFVHGRTCLHYCGAVAGAALIALSPLPARALLAGYQNAVTNEPSLISYYTFDQTNAMDLHGTNHGTLMGTTAFAAGVNGSGTALSLSGAGRVNLPIVTDFTFADGNGSVEAWVKPGNLKGDACIFANRDGYSRWDVHMARNTRAIGNWNGGSYLTVPIPNPGTTWHHLVVTYAGDFFTVYWDGTAVGTLSQPLGFTDFDKSTQIGATSPNANDSESWIGSIDEVAIYADALSSDAVQAHYNAFFAGDPPVIIQQPLGGAFIAGSAPTLTVKATGPSLAYQWYKAATALSAATNSALAFSNLTAANAGTYSVRVSNVTTTVTSSNATIALASLPARLVQYQTAVSNEASLISYYTFDRLLPEDAFGPNGGTLARTAGWAPGIGGSPAQGLLLDGAGRVDLGTVPSFDFASGIGTVEGWIRADWTNDPGYAPCMWADRNGGPTVWSLHLGLGANKDTPIFYNGSGGSWFVLPGGAGTNWHHIATVFDNGTASCYVDGNLLLYSPMGRPLGPGPGTAQIGSSASGSTLEGWIGMLDEVAFYSAALPAASIQAHYNAFAAGQPPLITSQPVGGSFLVGRLAQLSVGASGPQLAYQWYKDNNPIPEATNAIIGPVVLTAAFSGNYYVRISNSSGSTNSALAIVQVGNNIARYQTTVLGESSLISYYTFDAGDARDAKNAHPGTVANSVTYDTGPGGVTNLALTLDATGHIDLGQVADFDFVSGSGTVEGWIRPTWNNPAPYGPCVFADRDGGNGSVWSVHMDAWKTLMINFSSGAQSLSVSSDTGWHHYAIVFDAGTVAMYWDGQPLGSFSQSINSFLAKTTQIGSSSPTATTEGWVGGIDEVAFYGAAFGPDVIWRHYLAMVGPPSLSYSLSGTQLTLSWPADVTGFTLESSPSLPAAPWTPVSGVVSNQVAVDASVGMRFFRLRK
jgi:Concanavalin A-like lectin/glucanases superfamily